MAATVKELTRMCHDRAAPFLSVLAPNLAFLCVRVAPAPPVPCADAAAAATAAAAWWNEESWLSAKDDDEAACMRKGRWSA